MWTKLAETFAVANDETKAREALQHALEISNRTDSLEYHQRVCRTQIRLGYLEDAYATLKSMTNVRERSLPFSELALAAAKPRPTTARPGEQ